MIKGIQAKSIMSNKDVCKEKLCFSRDCLSVSFHLQLFWCLKRLKLCSYLKHFLGQSEEKDVGE